MLLKVFIVDDEIATREGIRSASLWDDQNFTLVGEAPDGEIALPMIADEKPDVVVTDIRMPFMDGLALSRAIKRSMPWIHIVILSGYSDFGYARQAISLGVEEYLLKPVTVEELRTVLERIREKKLEEKRKREEEQQIRSRMASGITFLQDKLLGSLLSEQTDEQGAARMRAQMENLGIHVTAPCYNVLDIRFRYAPEEGGRERGITLLQSLADSGGGGILLSTASNGAYALVMDAGREELEERWPDRTRKEREDLIAKEHGAVFISKIGGPLADGKPHDGRAPDYDDWSLNGDILFWFEPLGCALEVSSMGIRVDADSMMKQLIASNCAYRAALPYHRAILEDRLPLTIGGGIGQSRLCMLLLGRIHVGEVQASIWPDAMREECAASGEPAGFEASKESVRIPSSIRLWRSPKQLKAFGSLFRGTRKRYGAFKTGRDSGPLPVSVSVTSFCSYLFVIVKHQQASDAGQETAPLCLLLLRAPAVSVFRSAFRFFAPHASARQTPSGRSGLPFPPGIITESRLLISSPAGDLSPLCFPFRRPVRIPG